MVYNRYMSYSDAILKDRPVYIYNPPEPGPLTTVYKSTPLISDEGNAFLVRSGETFNSYATFSNTLDILKEYQSINPKMLFYVNSNPMSRFRTHNIAIARNFCLNFIRENKNHYPYFIMMDCDDVNCKEVNTDILKKYL